MACDFKINKKTIIHERKITSDDRGGHIARTVKENNIIVTHLINIAFDWACGLVG